MLTNKPYDELESDIANAGKRVSDNLTKRYHERVEAMQRREVNPLYILPRLQLLATVGKCRDLVKEVILEKQLAKDVSLSRENAFNLAAQKALQKELGQDGKTL